MLTLRCILLTRYCPIRDKHLEVQHTQYKTYLLSNTVTFYIPLFLLITQQIRVSLLLIHQLTPWLMQPGGSKGSSNSPSSYTLDKLCVN